MVTSREKHWGVFVILCEREAIPKGRNDLSDSACRGQAELLRSGSLWSGRDGERLWQRGSVTGSISYAVLPAPARARSPPSWCGTEPFGLVGPMC